MKKHLSFLLVFSFIFLLFGCQSASKHYIEENGSYYFVLDDLPPKPPVDNSGYGNALVARIGFTSVDEMRKRIRNADFDEDELTEIARFDRDSQGRVLMFDLSNIYVPYHPSAITGYKVFWYGNSYGYLISSNIGGLSMPRYTSIEGLNFVYENTAPENGHKETENMQKRTRSFTDASSTYRIIETYTYSVSKEFPSRIEVFVERNNQYFKIMLTDLQGPVTDEFLTQFEYRLYTPPAMPLWQKIAIGAGVAVVVAGIISAGILLRKRSLRRKYVHSDSEI